MRINTAAGAATAAAFVMSGLMASPAAAASSDYDKDGMPNRWEIKHKLNPRSAADAKADLDRDGLTNLREYRLKSLPRDEDTDNDGHDDGDELRTRTKVKDADSDNDGRRDGDEDGEFKGSSQQAASGGLCDGKKAWLGSGGHGTGGPAVAGIAERAA